jgi:hypothetical protein
MSTALDLIHQVEAQGGRLSVAGDDVMIAPRDVAMGLKEMARELLAHKAEIRALLLARTAQQIDDALPGEWLLENCLYLDRWWSGIGYLFFDLARWCAERGRPVPASRRAFETALRSDGFQLTADGFVYGLALREEVADFELSHSAPNAVCTTSPPSMRQALEPMPADASYASRRARR